MIHINSFAFDLDGTLLNSKGMISKETRELIKSLNNNYYVILISGRYYSEIIPYIKDVSGTKGCFIVCRDGMSIYSPDGSLINKKNEFSNEEVLDLYYKANNYNMAFYSESEDYYYFSKLSYYLRTKILTLNYDGKKRRMLMKINKKCIPINIDKILISDNLSQSIKDIIAQNYCMHKTDNHKIEVLPREVNKYNALKWLEEKKIIDLDTLLYFGDFYNDIECFERLRHTVAMGNACESIKKIAYYVTTSNDEDGIAFAFNRLLPKYLSRNTYS